MEKRKKKYYAVANGFHRGIFDQWWRCRLEVSGYSSAVFKSFETLEEAMNFMEVHDLDDFWYQKCYLFINDRVEVFKNVQKLQERVIELTTQSEDTANDAIS